MARLARIAVFDGQGAGTFSFYWKVSSESSYDFLEFYIDDVHQSGRISGTVDWQCKSYNITSSGSHTLKWRYAKGASAYGCSQRGISHSVVLSIRR